MRSPSLVLLAVLAGLAFSHPAGATSPRQVILPDTTYDDPPRPLVQVHPPWWGVDEGFLPVTVRVDTTGQVVDAFLAFDFEDPVGTAAVEAARQWTFVPAHKRGRPVELRFDVEVEMRHPRSGELVLPEDTLSVVSSGGEVVSLRASVTYDSVAANFRYTYQARNHSASDARVTGFALLGSTNEVSTGPDPRFTSWNTPEWRGAWYLFPECGGRGDLLAWGIWNTDPRTGSTFEAAQTPGSPFEPFTFRSVWPPGRVRWAARTAVDPRSPSALLPCVSEDRTRWEDLPLIGTTVGPVRRK